MVMHLNIADFRSAFTWPDILKHTTSHIPSNLWRDNIDGGGSPICCQTTHLWVPLPPLIVPTRPRVREIGVGMARYTRISQLAIWRRQSWLTRICTICVAPKYTIHVVCDGLPQIHNIGISFQHHALAAKIREVTRPHTEKATLLEYIHTRILIYSLSFTRLIVRTCLDFNVYSFPLFLEKFVLSVMMI